MNYIDIMAAMLFAAVIALVAFIEFCEWMGR